MISGLLLSVDVSDIQSLLCTCLDVNEYIMNNIDLIKSKHNLSTNTIKDLYEEYIDKLSDFNKMIVYIDRYNTTKFSNIFNNTLCISNDHYLIIIRQLMFKNYNTDAICDAIIRSSVGGHNYWIIRGCVDLCLEFDRSDILKRCGNIVNLSVKKYINYLFIDKQYELIHSIISMSRSLLLLCQEGLNKLFKLKDKDSIIKIFCPIIKDLDTSNIIQFITNINNSDFTHNNKNLMMKLHK